MGIRNKESVGAYNCFQVDSRVAAIFDRVYAGFFQDIPKPLSKLVRVFTSSTFTDTTTERNALMEDVYPKLKEYCRETHGLDFQVTFLGRGVWIEKQFCNLSHKFFV